MALELFSYENLDRIADSINPVTGLLAVGVAIAPMLAKRWRASGLRILALFSGLVVTYGLMFLDKRLGMWSAAGLDYSTHTAFALVIAAFLAMTLTRMALLWGAILAGYIALMLYQRYHTFYDIATTALAVLLLSGPLYWWLLSRNTATTQKAQ